MADTTTAEREELARSLSNYPVTTDIHQTQSWSGEPYPPTKFSRRLNEHEVNSITDFILSSGYSKAADTQAKGIQNCNNQDCGSTGSMDDCPWGKPGSGQYCDHYHTHYRSKSADRTEGGAPGQLKITLPEALASWKAEVEHQSQRAEAAEAKLSTALAERDTALRENAGLVAASIEMTNGIYPQTYRCKLCDSTWMRDAVKHKPTCALSPAPDKPEGEKPAAEARTPGTVEVCKTCRAELDHPIIVEHGCLYKPRHGCCPFSTQKEG
jgi:hypothetical protein